ncbi:hypothetical protein ACFPYJ_12090 [Paenibacillus solisilvae]|uniref:Uncharacterized protein n=1 Tax=Paenibacillus solisilvae TaxID=2486751 RepID=A0ABW0VYQ0_9BACL
MISFAASSRNKKPVSREVSNGYGRFTHRAYAKAQEHYGYAWHYIDTEAEGVVEAKTEEIRTTWDGMSTMTNNETEFAEFNPGGGNDRNTNSKKTDRI